VKIFLASRLRSSRLVAARERRFSVAVAVQCSLQLRNSCRKARPPARFMLFSALKIGFPAVGRAPGTVSGPPGAFFLCFCSPISHLSQFLPPAVSFVASWTWSPHHLFLFPPRSVWFQSVHASRCRSVLLFSVRTRAAKFQFDLFDSSACSFDFSHTDPLLVFDFLCTCCA
jgi:hypothetical protein